MGIAEVMRIYFLEEPLGTDDIAFVKEALNVTEEIEQVRVPYVLPVLSREAYSEAEHRKHENLLRSRLRGAGIGKDHGKQIVLVASEQMYWHAVLVGAVYEETGAYPWLVQTEKQRAAIGNPEATRLLDTHGLMGLKG
ncbi:MAG: hypothetical protein ACT4NU_01410 [Chromatiales bacterium]